jgi:hypothetical protein
VRLIVWNSQGAKWDVLWTNWAGPAVIPQTDDVVVLVVEAGWAPWIASGTVEINNVYPYDIDSRRYNGPGAANSPCCMAIEDSRRRKAAWIPWVNTPADMDAGIRTNSRCSMGAILMPNRLQMQGQPSRYVYNGHKRPVVRVQLGERRDVEITILLVHLISGYWRNAQAEMDDLTATMSTLIPQNTVGMVVGDMNVDLLTRVPNLPAGWSILNVGVATQQSGGELDWALLYNPAGQNLNTARQVLQQYKSGANQSDHSVMQYSVSW